jgi:hypothetical protein
MTNKIKSKAKTIDEIRDMLLNEISNPNWHMFPAPPLPTAQVAIEPQKTAAPAPEFNLEEGDNIIMLESDIASWLDNPKYTKGSTHKVLLITKGAVITENFQLSKSDFGRLYAYAPKPLEPKLYSDVTAERTEEYYDKYILD